MVTTLRTYGYVVTAIDDAGIAGVDAGNNTVALTWREVEELTLTLLLGKSIASGANEPIGECNADQPRINTHETKH